MEGLLTELQCPICLELYTHPVILPCSHVLCKAPCGERMFEHSFIKCPVCRDTSYVSGGIASLPRVITIENIIDRYRAETEDSDSTESDEDGSPLCQLCKSGNERKAKKICVDCNASYCHHCLELSHPNREPFSNHILNEPVKQLQAKTTLCMVHSEAATVYCQGCKTLGCNTCIQDSTHAGHPVTPVEQAYAMIRGVLDNSLQKLESSHGQLNEIIKGHRTELKELREKVQQSRQRIQQQCDALIAEIEVKRSFFLSDLQYEENSKTRGIENIIEEYQRQKVHSESLAHYAKEVLKETDPSSFLQLANSVNDKVMKGTPEASHLVISQTLQVKNNVVDFRKEKAMLRDMTYLSAPSTPVVDVSKCTRSSDSVVLVLQPCSYDDVVDGYSVCYCSLEQKAKGEQEIVTFKTPLEERKFGYSQAHNTATSLIVNNLESDTLYYFCVMASNGAGDSCNSDIINCTTMAKNQSRVPVPEIERSMCQSFTTSIMIFSPSPPESNEDTAHYLLYRESTGTKVWKSTPTYKTDTHRVFGLEPDTQYSFLILACNQIGECHMSNQSTLSTQRSAY
ncbi:unnamed protein product [Owenia fusiformis]|uniref:Uncharacterized protein n=1 Tax=Owenia fusiformis TaxID=6347 RepID=A0A8J1UAH2_OWEFU|nr:unnamed protein product [Owenia fusiformis]